MYGRSQKQILCCYLYKMTCSHIATCPSGPSGPVNLEFDPRDGKGHFTAREFGMHEVVVTNDGEAVKGAPNYIRSVINTK